MGTDFANPEHGEVSRISIDDRRLFKRYPHKAEFTVQIGDRPFRAETTDYSLSGLGILFMDHPPVGIGNTFEISLGSPPSEHPAMATWPARVMWIKNTNGHTKVGLSLEKPLDGSIEEFEIADVFIGLQRGGRTGIFEFESGRALKKVFVKDGDMVYATSSLHKDDLAALLYSEGRLTEEQYRLVAALQRQSKKKQGTILVETGMIKPSELSGLFRHMVEEIILSVFSFASGRFRFRPGPLPDDDIINLDLSTANMIYKGLTRITDIERLRRACPKDDEILGLSSDPLDLFQDIVFNEKDKKILSGIDGKTPFKYLIGTSPAEEAETLRAVYALMSTRMVEIKDRPTQQEVTAKEILSRDAMDQSIVLDAVEEMYQRCEKRNYFELLGVRATCTDTDVRNAYYRLAKEFHPDLHFHLPIDVKAKLNCIFSNISTAYALLKTPDGRAQHRKSVEETPRQSTRNSSLARARCEEGKDQLAKGSIGRAELLFAEAKYLDSKPEYHYLYGFTLVRLKKFKDAERELKAAYSQDPDNPDILAELGHVYLAMGFPTRAKGNFERALKHNPSHERALEGLSLLKGMRTKVD